MKIGLWLALVAGTAALAQPPNHTKFRGVINDFTPAAMSPGGPISPGGPWEIHGPWSLTIKGRHFDADFKADFSAALSMERSDAGIMQNDGGNFDDPAGRMAHTHHITMVNGTVTTIPGGIEITGSATVTANGIFPPPFGADIPTLTIDITGGTGENSVPFSNITLTFGQPAAGHFGTQPIHGVVRSVK